MTLSEIASYRIDAPRHPFRLVLAQGSVVDFAYPANPARSAIVNAANAGCLGGGGVDGAIGAAGGPALRRDRRALPEVVGAPGSSPGSDVVRCPVGGAVTTGPGDYGTLATPYVVHAVGPNYQEYDDGAEELASGDRRLASAYARSLACGEAARLEALAFCLLSAGIFRGPRSLEAVLRIGLRAISKFAGYEGLKEVHVCGFTKKEVAALVKVANDLGLSKIESASGPENDTSTDNADAASNADNLSREPQEEQGKHEKQQLQESADTAASANHSTQEPQPGQGQQEKQQPPESGGKQQPQEEQEGEGDAREEWEIRRDDLKGVGDAHFRARAYAPAIQAYADALQLDPAHPALLSNKSAAHLAHGEKSKALQDAQRCVAAAGSWAKGHTRLAAAMASLGRTNEAAGVYAKVLNELDSENAVAKRGLEECRGKQRREREAREREARQLQAELNKQKAEEEDEKPGKEEEDLMDDFFSEVEAVSKPRSAKADANGDGKAGAGKNRIKIQLSDLGTSAAQIDRLLQPHHEWKNLNPFHVLDMPHRVDDEAVISTRYRALSLLVHPDKCPADPARAKQAFEQVRGAMAQLNDADKRRHVRALVEQGRKQGAREWVAANGGQGDTAGRARVQDAATMKIFAEIEQKRRNIDRRKRKYEQRERAQEDEEKGKEKSEREHDKKWREGERVEKRIGNWRDFQGGGGGGRGGKKVG